MRSRLSEAVCDSNSTAPHGGDALVRAKGSREGAALPLSRDYLARTSLQHACGGSSRATMCGGRGVGGRSDTDIVGWD